MSPTLATRTLASLGLGLGTLSCVGEVPPFASCPTTRLELVATGPGAAVDVVSFVMVGFDTGPLCSGTIIHLDDSSAYVVTARHCMTWDDGRLRLPAARAHVYFPRQDAEGFYWEPRHASRVVLRAGADQTTTKGAITISDRDWAILIVPREPAMRAVELARDVPPTSTPVALVTMRTQDRLERPCAHVRTFRWGELTELMMGGYSGAAVVADGRVQALFVGGRTQGTWLFHRVTSLMFTSPSSIGQPWLDQPPAPPPPVSVE